jgi:nicotinamidase-related amidase
MGQEPYGIFGTIKELGAFAAGSWGSEPAEVLDADASDVIIRGKSTACSFASTSLQDWLDENNTKTLILSGLLSNICVEATMRTAYDRGFNVIVVADCVAALDHEHHRTAMANNWPFFAHITTARDFAWSAPADIES